MNKNIFLSTVLCGLCFAPFAASANDKVDTTYNAQKYQQVCKGKTQGAQVSFAHRGIIWNGTCEPQFFASSKNASIKGDEAELMSTCSGNSSATSATINGTEVKGKCALGFVPPRPQGQSQMQNQPMQPQMSQPQMQNQPMQAPMNDQNPSASPRQTQPGM